MDVESKLVEIAEGVAETRAHLQHLATKEDLRTTMVDHLASHEHKRSVDWQPIVRAGAKILVAVAGAVGAAAAFYFAL